jgi:hypothetical protein
MSRTHLGPSLTQVRGPCAHIFFYIFRRLLDHPFYTSQPPCTCRKLLRLRSTATMAFVEYKDHPLFPAAAPRGQAHVLEDSIGCDEEGPGQMPRPDYQLCDFITTLLYKLEQYPNALQDFFNPEIKSFKLVRHYGDGKICGIRPFMIWRRQYDVIVSPKPLPCSMTAS